MFDTTHWLSEAECRLPSDKHEGVTKPNPLKQHESQKPAHPEHDAKGQSSERCDIESVTTRRASICEFHHKRNQHCDSNQT
jgi:hypothetical protein